MNGGQAASLFSGTSAGWFIYIAVGRVLQPFRKRGPYFFWRRQNLKIRIRSWKEAKYEHSHDLIIDRYIYHKAVLQTMDALVEQFLWWGAPVGQNYNGWPKGFTVSALT